MEINQGHRRIKLFQNIITGVLLLVLCSMLGVYIYYGMYIARTNTMVDQTPVVLPQEIINVGGTSVSPEVTLEERYRILEELSSFSGPLIPVEGQGTTSSNANDQTIEVSDRKARLEALESMQQSVVLVQ